MIGSRNALRAALLLPEVSAVTIEAAMDGGGLFKVCALGRIVNSFPLSLECLDAAPDEPEDVRDGSYGALDASDLIPDEPLREAGLSGKAVDAGLTVSTEVRDGAVLLCVQVDQFLWASAAFVAALPSDCFLAPRPPEG